MEGDGVTVGEIEENAIWLISWYDKTVYINYYYLIKKRNKVFLSFIIPFHHQKNIQPIL